MGSYRKVGDDILKDWLDFREEKLDSLTCKEDKKHFIYFEEIAENILRNVPECNKKYVRQQLHKLDDDFLDYCDYWNEKYYRNGFCDGVQIIYGMFLTIMFHFKVQILKFKI